MSIYENIVTVSNSSMFLYICLYIDTLGKR